MAFVVTDGQIAATHRSGRLPVTSRVQLADDVAQSYEELWRRQPQIRTVVSFLGRNIAQINLHVFERLSDVDRRRLTDHPLAQLLGRPNPRTTRYRLMDSLVQDLGIFDNAFWLKVKLSSGQTRGLLRIPPQCVKPVGDSWLWPEKYKIGDGSTARVVDADSIVHFRGYNPADARWGVSPMETLRRILAEEYQAGVAREQLWRNGARFPGYIKRPLDAPKWSNEARSQFQTDWTDAYTGTGRSIGGTPILEDGMDFTASGITPADAQYLEARKLTREEVAAAYHIPLPMVGILDHATFSNIKEQHQQLYQDTLGPWLRMIEEELTLQLLPDLDETRNVYLEFNLAEKMRGSFEEQAQALQTAVGVAWMTTNEARARMNLPQLPGGDELKVPLNVIGSTQAPSMEAAPKQAPAGRRAKSRPTRRQQEEAAEVFKAFFARQRATVLSILGAGGEDWWDGPRWDRELSADLLALSLKSATRIARAVLDQYGLDPAAYDPDRTAAFLDAVAQARAKAVNTVTRHALTEALDDDGDKTPAGVFDDAQQSRSQVAASTLMTTLAGFATVEAAQQVSGGKARKTWNVNSANPRPSHALLDGETVAVGQPFSNGAQWPGDSSALYVDDIAGCSCGVTIDFS